MAQKIHCTLDAEDSGLVRALGTWDLILLGIGATVGAGIFVLTGVAAAACTFAALSYAELAASIGGSGSGRRLATCT